MGCARRGPVHLGLRVALVVYSKGHLSRSADVKGKGKDACDACQAWVMANILRIEALDPVLMMDDASFFLKNRGQPGGADDGFHGCASIILPWIAHATSIEAAFLDIWCASLNHMSKTSVLRRHFQELVSLIAPGQRSHRTVSHFSFTSVAHTACSELLGICNASFALWRPSLVVEVCQLVANIAKAHKFSVGGVGFCQQRFGLPQSVDLHSLPPAPSVLMPNHPLLKHKVEKRLYDDLLADEIALTIREASRSSPLQTTGGFRVAYLVQAASADELSPVWRHLPRTASLLVLTFKEAANGAIFFPKSSMNEGRNLLYLATRQAERAQGWHYNYVILLEPEIKFLRGGFVEFQNFLQSWQPAVAVPGYYPAYAAEGWPDYHRRPGEEAYAIGRIDFHFIAYHWAALTELWPMDTRQDAGGCWWGSHWLQQQLMSIKYRGFVLATRHVIVHNEIHSSYPKENCLIVQPIIDTWLSSVLKPEHDHCLLTTNASRGQAWGTATKGNSSFYSPWNAASLHPVDCTVTQGRMPAKSSRCSEASACLAYPLQISEILRRPFDVFSPPGDPRCFENVGDSLEALDRRNMMVTGNVPQGIQAIPGAGAWRSCCQGFTDGLDQLLFGYFPCWNSLYTFSRCCYVTQPPLVHESLVLAPHGDQAPAPDNFGLHWAGLAGACRSDVHVSSPFEGLEWYMCDTRAAIVTRGSFWNFESSKKDRDILEAALAQRAEAEEGEANQKKSC